MPPSKQPSPLKRGDIWRRQEHRIRKLYKDNTVENVKRIMEQDGLFPKMVLSTWIEKLGELGIRKNVSSEEWRKIYRHIIPRLEDPTRPRGDLKLKRTKKRTEIIVRGRKFAWNPAWKNMKSANAIGQLPRPEGPPSPLPSDIIIRTPTPTSPLIFPASSEGSLGQPTRTIGTMATCSSSFGHMLCQPKDQLLGRELMPLIPTDHFGPGPNESMVDYGEKVWKFCLAGLPIGNFIHYTINIANLAMPSRAYLQDPQQTQDLTFPSIDLPLALDIPDHEAASELRWNLTHQFLSVVFGQPLASTDLATFASHKHYVEMFTIIFLLSNHLIDEDDPPKGDLIRLFRELDSIFAAIPGWYLQDLLHSRLASIRAAFENLISLSGCYQQPQAFDFLVKVGVTYGWLNVLMDAQLLLLYAASMDLTHTLQTLLENGCRPESNMIGLSGSGEKGTTAIVVALERKNFGCAQLLLQYCDVNRDIEPMTKSGLTNFTVFVYILNKHDELFEYGLELFIQAGADLDAELPIWAVFGPGESEAWFSAFSVLDYLFYFRRPLFQKYSSKLARVQRGRLGRSDVLLAFEGGTQNLKHYLDNLGPQIDQSQIGKFLTQMLAEQFLFVSLPGRKKAIDMETVHALVSFGASMKKVLHWFPDLLYDLTREIGIDFLKDEARAAQYLLENGAAVNDHVLSLMAQLPDTRLLDLARGSVDSTTTWATVLIRAATSNKFEAVERLLHTGVDLCIDLRDRFGRRRLSIIANVIAKWRLDARELPGMVDFLVKKGAPLRLSARRVHPYYLLQFVMRFGNNFKGATLGIVQYIVGAGYDPRDPSFPSASLLKYCQWLPDGINVFEYLLRNGAQLRPGFPLTAWLTNLSELGSIRVLLEAGAPVNYYTEGAMGKRCTALQNAAARCRLDVVELLLQAGADVNAPARGDGGHTALQGACAIPMSPGEDQQKSKIIQVLLSHGADVNAAPARRSGETALQEAARVGDLTIAKLLLFHFPMADINAPPSQNSRAFPSGGTALDEAAANGRIDMVKLLLNCNALSHHRGETGYDGAIHWAKRWRHFAVAELISQHVKDADRSDTRNPYLSQPARDWREYGYELGPDEDSEPDDAEDDRGSFIDEWSRDETDSVTSSDINSQDPSDAASDLGVHNSTQPLAHDEPPLAATRSDNPWEDQRDLQLELDGDLAAATHLLYSSQAMSHDASMDLSAFMGFDLSEDFAAPTSFHMDFDSEIKPSSEVHDAAPWVFENEGMGSFGSVGPFERLIEEVGEDCE